MAGKTKRRPPGIGDDPNKSRHVQIVVQPGQSPDVAIAEAALSPLVGNASTAVDYSRGLFPDLCLNDCVEVLKAQVQTVNKGDLSNVEATLLRCGRYSGQCFSLNFSYIRER